MRRFVVTMVVAAGSWACFTPGAGNPHMWSHYDQAADANAAVIRGDLHQARLAGEWLASHETDENLPPQSEPMVVRMRRHAQALAIANDIPNAAINTAGLARACGECHRVQGPGPDFRGRGVPPAEGSGTGLEMRQHSWAAGRMWEGLIGPSDSAWAAGARTLVNAPLATDSITIRADVQRQVRELETRVHDIGLRGMTVTGGGERESLYAELISTCATCHEMVRRRE